MFLVHFVAAIAFALFSGVQTSSKKYGWAVSYALCSLGAFMLAAAARYAQ